MKKMEGQTHSSVRLELAKSSTLKKLHPKMNRFPSLASAPVNPLKPIFPGGDSLKSGFVLRSGLCRPAKSSLPHRSRSQRLEARKQKQKFTADERGWTQI